MKEQIKYQFLFLHRRACSQHKSNSQETKFCAQYATELPQYIECLHRYPNLGDGAILDEIHGLADSLLHPPLDLLLLPLGEVSLGVAAGRAVVSHGQLVVVLAGSVSHQMGIVGRGWVGHGPNNMRIL